MRTGIRAITLLLLSGTFLPGTFALATRHKAKPRHKVAAAQKPKIIGAAGLIASAQHELDSGNLSAAVEYSTAAASKAPILADYAAYIQAQAEYRLKSYSEVAKSVAHVFNQVPVSPLTGPAGILAVHASLDNGAPKQSLDLVRKFYDRILQPQADLLLAESLQANGDLPQAAEYFQRVYYHYPSSKEAADAATALVEIKQKLAEAYPPPMPTAMIARAQKLFDERNAAAAKTELAAAIPQLGGAERDLAQVRLGVADYLTNHTEDAFAYLSTLKVDDPEADAERLSYLIRCARKLDHHADVKPFLTQLEQQHARSLWRMDALMFVADAARVDNDPNTYLPLYGACAASFSADPRSGWCHWQLAFHAYRADGQDTSDLLRSQIETYPDFSDVNDALYFLGRFSERKNDLPGARACYDELLRRFPNTYYAIVARERLSDPGIKAAAASPAMTSFLAAVKWPQEPQFPSFNPGKLAQSRLDRARDLELAGLRDWAEGELKFGARNDGEQQNVYAFALARMASARDSADQAMRFIKAYAPGYLYMSLEQAPVAFWKLAFPLPFRPYVELYSQQQSLDPYLVAALIRQESEFNPKVVSHANAYGLMQLLPATGRELARHFRIRRFSTSQLLSANRNIQLGTYFFHNLLNSYGGRTELALASYNAGPSRAKLWESWGPYGEQAEFVESVPFHETRNYIQVVLRNADVYRRLYSKTVPDVPQYRAKPAPKTKLKPKRRPRRRRR